MESNKAVVATKFVRRLRGRSQPILVQANDGLAYAVKFWDNPQGPNVLFNEVFGVELFRSAGLPVPEWSPVHLSDDFLNHNPESWILTRDGARRPASGWCFGSRHLDLRGGSLFEILPKHSFSRIQNRKDFWMVWVLDVLCDHTDNRQALFLEDSSRRLEAFFIDHGCLFGGPAGGSHPRFEASRFLDSRIYPELNKEDGYFIGRAIRQIPFGRLEALMTRIPEAWRPASAIHSFEKFFQRLRNRALLECTIDYFLGYLENGGNHDGADSEFGWIPKHREALYAAILQA